jgi:hypothetical protein
VKAFLIPVSDQVMKKKYNGSAALEDEDRKEIIDRMVSNKELEIEAFYGMMEGATESLGEATKEIIKKCMEEGMAKDLTFITVLPMHRLDMAVRITDSIAYN